MPALAFPAHSPGSAWLGRTFLSVESMSIRSCQQKQQRPPCHIGHTSGSTQGCGSCRLPPSSRPDAMPQHKPHELGPSGHEAQASWPRLVASTRRPSRAAAPSSPSTQLASAAQPAGRAGLTLGPPPSPLTRTCSGMQISLTRLCPVPPPAPRPS